MLLELNNYIVKTCEQLNANRLFFVFASGGLALRRDDQRLLLRAERLDLRLAGPGGQQGVVVDQEVTLRRCARNLQSDARNEDIEACLLKSGIRQPERFNLPPGGLGLGIRPGGIKVDGDPMPPRAETRR